MDEELQVRRTQRWEHDVFFWNHPATRTGGRVDAGMRAMLGAKGIEGWELVAVPKGRPRTNTCFFNRLTEA